MGTLVNSDAELYRKWFKEGCRLRGIAVKYTYPIVEEATLYSEIQPSFSEEIDMDVLFEENPQIKTLKNIGWNSEDPENKPAIAYLPWDCPQLQTKSRIFIPPVGTAIPGRWFEVTSIHANLEYADSYIVTLAPVFEKQRDTTNYEESNYNVVRDVKANQPHEDQPASLSHNVNFRFIKDDKLGE